MTYIVDANISHGSKHPTFFGRISAALTLHSQRTTLKGLSDDALKDIGLTRTDVNRECAKTFFSDLIR